MPGQEQSGSRRPSRSPPGCPGRPGGSAIGTVEVDSRNIDQTLAHHDAPASIRTVCALLTNDAETAIGNLPTPDTSSPTISTPPTRRPAAGNDCYNGAAGRGAAQAVGRRARGQLLPLLATAVDRIESVTGHPPSTSTTQPDGSCGDPFGGCNGGREPEGMRVADGDLGAGPDGQDADAYDRMRRRVLWSMPTGLFVVGSRSGMQRNLMTCNWVTQVATTPKLVALSVERGSVTGALIAEGGGSRSACSSRADRALVRRFVKPVEDIETDRAGRGAHHAGRAGARGGRGAALPGCRGLVAVLSGAAHRRIGVGRATLARPATSCSSAKWWTPASGTATGPDGPRARDPAHGGHPDELRGLTGPSPGSRRVRSGPVGLGRVSGGGRSGG